MILWGFLFFYWFLFLFLELFSAEQLCGKLFLHLLIRNAIFFCLGPGDTLCEFNNFINSRRAAPHDNSGTAAESQSNNQRESISVQIKPRRRCSACKLPPRKTVGMISGAAVVTNSPLAARFLGTGFCLASVF